jgi:hypothetical protein
MAKSPEAVEEQFLLRRAKLVKSLSQNGMTGAKGVIVVPTSLGAPINLQGDQRLLPKAAGNSGSITVKKKPRKTRIRIERLVHKRRH